MDEKETELIMGKSTMKEERNRIISDAVKIEIVHAFKEIIIKYIDRKYWKNA
jgi:hypothetical protein